MVIVSPEFSCSHEALTIAAMLSGEPSRLITNVVNLYCPLVPNIWLRPVDRRTEADRAKQELTVPLGDHLTLLNVFNEYQNSELVFRCMTHQALNFIS